MACIKNFKHYSVDDKLDLIDSILDTIDSNVDNLSISDIIDKIFEETLSPIIKNNDLYDTSSIAELYNFIKSEIKNNDEYRNYLTMLSSRLEQILLGDAEFQADERSQPEISDIDDSIYPTFLPIWNRMDTLFEHYPDIKSKFIYNFLNDIINKLLVDFDKRIIILDNPKLLNKNIFDFKIQILEELSQYLIDLGLEVEIPENYHKNLKLTEEGIKFYYLVLELARKLFNPNTMSYIYQSSLSNDISSRKTMKAFNNFLLLSTDGRATMGLDELIEYCFPKLVSIEKSSLFGNQYMLKFERTVGKPFGNDRMTDGEKTMGIVSKLLLKSVPAIQSNGIINGVLAYDQILKTFSIFSDLNVWRKASVHPELYKPLINLFNSPLTSLSTLLDIVLNRSKLTYLSVFNFSESDKIVLRSLYERFFNPNNPNSLLSIELSKIRQNNAITSFNIVSAVIGGLIRQEDSLFLQTKFKETNLVTESINSSNTNSLIAQIGSRISLEIKHAGDLLDYRINRLNLRFNTLPENSDLFEGMVNDSIAFDIQLASGKNLTIVINSKSETLTSNLILIYDGDKLVNFKRNTKLNPNELNLTFPTSTLIARYFTGNLNSEILENPGLEIPLAILSSLSKIIPNLKLTTSNIQILILWLNNSEYDTNPENRETFFLNQISEVFHVTARNTLIQLKINQHPDIEITKLMEDYPSINDVKIFNWFDTGTQTINLLWEKPKMGFRQLATATDLVLQKVKKMISDAEGNKLPKSRNFTVINHIGYYIQQMLNDPNAILLKGIAIESIAALKNNILAKPENLLSLGSSYVYIDVTNESNEIKKVNKLTSNEFIYNNFVNLYLGTLLDSDSSNIYILPTTFSDKGTIVVIGIPKNKFKTHSGLDLNLSSITIEQLKDEISYSIGGYYKTILKNVLNDYRKIFGQLSSDYLKNLIKKVESLLIDDNLHSSVKNQLNSFKQAVINRPELINDWGIDVFAGLFTVIENILPLKDIANQLSIEFINDVHFSTNPMLNIGLGKFSINYQLYYYAEKLFGNLNLIELYYNNNLQKFINSFSLDMNLHISNPIILKAVLKFNLETWVDELGNLLLTKNGEINPLVERYFYTLYLLKLNLKQVLAGGEFGHPHKLKLKFGSSEFDSGTTFLEIMIREESGRMTSSFKRTVDEGVPGIMAIQKDILTITPKVRSAIISDCKAPNYNIYGQSENTDAHDGSSFTHPLYNILMRLGQLDCAGGEILKMILRDLHSKYGVNILYKYASDAFMNYDMRNSLAANDIEDEINAANDIERKIEGGRFLSINFRTLFKKLSSLEFNIEHDEIDKVPESAKFIRIIHKDGSEDTIPYEINLTENLFGLSIKPTDMSAGKPIYFRRGNKYYQLLNLERSKDKRTVISDNTLYDVTILEVYNNEGKLLMIGDPIINENIEINTIDSLFEILGGIYSVDFKEGNFVYGNTSLYTLANYVNNIGRTYNPDGTRAYTYPTLDNTWQPLKTKFIASLTNQSAIKNGAANVNPVSRFYNEEPLNTQTIRTGTHLLVQDYDHIVTDGETTLSEFTLVITSVILLGNSFNQTEKLFKALTGIASSLMFNITKAVNLVLLNSSKRKELYYTIGKLLIEDAKGTDKQSNLYLQLIINLSKQFEYSLQNDDSFKFPFSDPQAFTTSVLSIISAVNKLSIKRKFPGSGLIMAPAYGYAKNFNIPGLTTKSFLDLLNWLYNVKLQGSNWESKWSLKVLSVNFDETTNKIKSVTLDGQPILNSTELEYLDIETATNLYRIILNLKETYKDLDLSSLSSNLQINIEIILNHINNQDANDVNLQTVNNFRNYIKYIQKALFENKLVELKPLSEIQLELCIVLIGNNGKLKTVNIDSLEKLQFYLESAAYQGFYIDYSLSRNLMPTLIKFKDKSSGKSLNLYNLPIIKLCFKQLLLENIDKEQEKQLRLIIDSELHQIHDGYYTSKANLIQVEGNWTLSGIETSEILENSLEVSDYEAKIPMIFKTEFGLKEGDSLAEILELGYTFFKNRYLEKYVPSLLSGYDICFTKNTGKHDYITFVRNKNSKEVFVDPIYLEERGDYKWVVDTNGNRLYARYKKRVDENGNPITLISTDENGNRIELEIWDDYIIQLVSPNGITENLYYIAYGETEQEKAEVASSMYNIHKNETLYINPNLFKNRLNYVRELFNSLQNKNIYIPLNHLELLSNLNETNLSESIVEINDAFLMSDTKAKSIFNSFKKSLELIVARIPAQSMQSFMKMKVVGFLETDKNYIQVSHFLTWILGSDYKLNFSLLSFIFPSCL